MPRISAEYWLMGGVILIIFVLGITLAYWMIRDRPAGQHRLSWHQLIKDNFHLSFIDSMDRSWTIDIHYNDGVGLPHSTLKGENHLRVQLPFELTYLDYVAFVNDISGIDRYLLSFLKGVISEKFLEGLKLSHNDLATYRDFRRHFLLKALKRA